MHDKLCRHGSYGVAILGRNLEILATNSAFCSLLGYTETELISVFVEQLFDPSYLTEFRSATARIFTQQIAFAELELQCISNRGESIPVNLTIDTLEPSENGGRTGLSLLLRNLSHEKKQAQEFDRIQWFLSTTFDTIDQGVTIYDREFRLVAWNNRYKSLKIFPDEFLRQGTYLVDAYKSIAKLGVFGVGDPTLIAQNHINALVNGNVKPVEELKSLTGRQVEIRRYLLPEGGLVAVFTDITEQRNAEEQLRHSQKMQAIGQLTGGIAHDFNNLLAIIMGNVEQLGEKIGPDELLQPYVEAALGGTSRAAELTHRLLAFSRRQPLNPMKCNLMLDRIALGIINRYYFLEIQLKLILFQSTSDSRNPIHFPAVALDFQVGHLEHLNTVTAIKFSQVASCICCT